MSKRKKIYREPESLVRCPACGAMSHPYRKEGEGLSNEEREGIFCKSCHINLVPILKKISQEVERIEAERKLNEQLEKEKVNNEIQKIKELEENINDVEVMGVTECKE